MSGTPLQPVTQRTGGGVSARVVALVGVAALLGLVWLGASDQPSEPAATDALAAFATPTPSASEPSPEPTLSPSIDPSPAPQPSSTRPGTGSGGGVIPLRYGPLGEDAFAVTVWLRERFYMSVLREDESGHLAAVMRLPLFNDMPKTRLQLIQLWTRDDRPPLAEVADYRIDLGLLLDDAQAQWVLIDSTRNPRPRRANAPRLIREGYQLQVTTQVKPDHALLLFHVRVGDAPLRRMTEGWSDYGQRGGDTVAPSP